MLFVLEAIGLIHFALCIMKQNLSLHPLVQFMHLLSLLAAVVLVVALSVEIIGGNNLRFSRGYYHLQLVICLVFLIDLTIRYLAHGAKGWKAFGYLLFFLLAVPWLNVAHWAEWELSRSESMVVASMPLLRSFLALYLVVSWMIQGRVRQLFLAYVITVVLFTYLSALVFYDFEVLVNPHLRGFGNALWLAWMNVTTVGASIFPVTTVGKVICVLLPIVGMAMFPIFTVYITALYNKRKKGES